MRLVRMGDKKSPVYRIVVVDARVRRQSRLLRSQVAARYADRRRGEGEGLDCQGRSADRDGKVFACKDGRYRKIRKAQPRENQRQEKEVIAFA